MQPLRPVLEVAPSETEVSALRTALGSASTTPAFGRAIMRGVVEQGSQTVVTRCALVFQRPNRIRIEFFPPNGFMTLSLLVINEQGATFIDPSQHLAIRSEDPRRVVQQMFHISWSIEQLLALFLGQLPGSISDEAPIAWGDSGRSTFLIVDQAGSSRFLVGNGDLQLKHAQFLDPFSEKVNVDVIYQRPNVGFGSGTLVGGFELRLPRLGTVVSLDQAEFVGGEIPRASLFEVDIPPDFELIER